MSADEVTYRIRQLAYNWARFELPTFQLTYTDYVTTLTELQQATGRIEHTEELFAGVILQTNRLEYSSDWAAAELRFEALACLTGDRPKAMLLDLGHRAADDDALDLYNHRLTRFTNHE